MPFFRKPADRMQPAPRKDLARTRGTLYFEYARKYQQKGDYRNALTTAQEGARLAAGPFYLAVQEQLRDLIHQLNQQILDDPRPVPENFRPIQLAHLNFGR